jgi:uncharacterized protein with HEPN domain
MPSEPQPTSKEELAWLAIRDNAGLAQTFVAGMTAEQFAADRKTFYAITRCLEIISEAARRLGPEQKARFPDLEWRQIQDSGNAFRHAYHRVAESMVWTTVTDRLPDLLRAAEAAMPHKPARTHRSK